MVLHYFQFEIRRKFWAFQVFLADFLKIVHIPFD